MHYSETSAILTLLRFGVLVMELIERVFSLLDRWKDGQLFTLGRKRVSQSTAADDENAPQQSTHLV